MNDFLIVGLLAILVVLVASLFVWFLYQSWRQTRNRKFW